MECGCEGVSLTGRYSLAAYWAPKLEGKQSSSFSLEDIILIGDLIQLDYLSYEGKPVRIQFRFNPSGKILHTSCGPSGR
jgi:hypothetical protein